MISEPIVSRMPLPVDPTATPVLAAMPYVKPGQLARIKFVGVANNTSGTVATHIAIVYPGGHYILEHASTDGGSDGHNLLCDIWLREGEAMALSMGNATVTGFINVIVSGELFSPDPPSDPAKA